GIDKFLYLSYRTILDQIMVLGAMGIPGIRAIVLYLYATCFYFVIGGISPYSHQHGSLIPAHPSENIVLGHRDAYSIYILNRAIIYLLAHDQRKAGVDFVPNFKPAKDHWFFPIIEYIFGRPGVFFYVEFQSGWKFPGHTYKFIDFLVHQFLSR